MFACLLPICAVIASAGGVAAPVDDAAAVKAQFQNPPIGYSSAPLWVWNDMLSEADITATMEALAGQNVRQVFVHPRPGLMTPYMSEDWWRLWRHTLKEAERLDMNAWIYDENSYPSGFAGGFVPEAIPEMRTQGVTLKPMKAPVTWNDKMLAVYAKQGDAYKLVTEDVKAGRQMPDGEYLVAGVEETDSTPWFAGKFYVDLLRPEVTHKFLDITLEAYKRESGGLFPARVPGSFTDEPHLAPKGDFHWTKGLPDLFKARWGYDLIENLPSLTEQTGDWKRVRHDYNQLILELFINNWGKPYYEYCARNNIEFTGHYWEHEWPNPKIGPDNMAMSAWQQRPGIDILFNDPFDFGPHAQVGNSRAILEIASVANQMGHPRTLCEAYGGGGWDLRFEDMKRIGDWLCCLGINTLDQHLSHVSIRGARKRDYPQTFSYHEPWWNQYGGVGMYFWRLSMATSQGRQLNKIILIEPTTSAWMYAREKDAREEIGVKFQRLVHDMLAAQIEFDLGSEDVLARNGSISGKELVVGRCSYDTIVIPAKMENVNSPTLSLLEKFCKSGGRIIAAETPSLVDGRASDKATKLATLPGWTAVAQDKIPDTLKPKSGDAFVITRADDKALLFHMRRTLKDGEILFLCNSSPDLAASGTIESSAAKGIEQWELESGATFGYPSTASGNGVKAEFNLPPSGSLLLFLAKEPVTVAQKPALKGTPVEASGELAVKRVEPNVLTLDYCDVEAGGETKANVPFKTAAAFAFQKNGMERDPWDAAVQFKDEFIKIKFPESSGFTVSYKFTIEGQAPNPLTFVVERPDLYTIECNGKPVTARQGEWWLDRAFGRIDISAAAKTGENVVTVKATPFSVFHEIEAAFVLGDFAVKPVDKGFVIAAAQPLKLGPWNEQGCQLYGNGVTYTRKFKIDSASGNYFVSLPEWYGSVASVNVNGKPAGIIFHQPFACDVTKLIQSGENTVDVTVCGTLRNTLGPHHGKPRLGLASPGSWNKAPESGPPAGAEYDSQKYGMFKEFELLREQK
jgi:hypothetical protein